MTSSRSRLDGKAFLRALWPATQHISASERFRSIAGASLGVLITAFGAALLLNGQLARDHAVLAAALFAPVGASAVLVFMVPSSPLAQPWSVIGGNTLSALVGIACVRWIPNASLAAGLAVGLAITVMLAARCLHPPGGAAALTMVLTGCDRFGFALHPILLNSAVLVAAGIIYNNLNGHSWPYRPRRTTPTPAGARFTDADLDAALARYNQIVDINRDDLQELLQHAEAAAYRRTMGELRCADVMSRDPVTARTETSLRQAWTLMRKHKVKALPVVDLHRRLVGIVTVADFMKQVDLDVHEGMSYRLRALVRQVREGSRAPHTVGQIMTRQVQSRLDDSLLIDLVPVFSDSGHRHVPVVDGERRLTGIITQSDLVRALYSAVRG
ncbi:HPP family protein [Bordetella genomosp. 13]|nr:HPP family protein [Bordetella genomosp. 13]